MSRSRKPNKEAKLLLAAMAVASVRHPSHARFNDRPNPRRIEAATQACESSGEPVQWSSEPMPPLLWDDRSFFWLFLWIRRPRPVMSPLRSALHATSPPVNWTTPSSSFIVQPLQQLGWHGGDRDGINKCINTVLFSRSMLCLFFRIVFLETRAPRIRIRKCCVKKCQGFWADSGLIRSPRRRADLTWCPGRRRSSRTVHMLQLGHCTGCN
jgi:hypothetical protein